MRTPTLGLLRAALAATTLLTGPALAVDDWQPAPGRLMTKWAKDVKPDQPWPQYPRPAMVRDRWLNLNGLWDYTIAAPADPAAVRQSGRILVPYPPESALSGVGRTLAPEETLTYARSFTLPADWAGSRVLLHFGAVDWHARVSINGTPIGEHQGGYAPFSFDITQALKPGPNQLAVAVTDPTDTGGQPRGKQWLKPHGIWYTPTSGIWQTVWLEPVPTVASISSLNITPDAAGSAVTITAGCAWRSAGTPPIHVEVLDGDKLIASGGGEPGSPQRVRLKIPNAKLWTPQSPHLYDLRVRFTDQGVTDTVTSYFALRDVAVAKDADGINRLTLNGRPIFMFGPLDQGFWPDGLYTPPTEEAMRFDIDAVRAMGGNMLRKHVKVEPQRFYWWCDKLGVMVWQDIPSPFFHDRGDNPHRQPPLTDAWRRNFERETREIIAALAHHPSIVMWVPFNEGWGQNDLPWCKSVVEMVKQADPTRLVNNASGWTDMHVGDVNDIHVYPGPATPPTEPARAAILGEYGGLGLPLEGHTWVNKNNWGYVSYKNKDELTDAYTNQISQLPLLAAQGLCAAVYTQTTDVEIECNGWLTYDRAVWKIDPARAAAAAAPLLLPWPRIEPIAPRSTPDQPVSWRFTTEPPEDAWTQPEFDDHAWRAGPGGFGARGTPGASIGAEWRTSDIWLRRTFNLAAAPSGQLALHIHHDEDAEVYLNGRLVASLKGYTTAYQHVTLDDDAVKSLRAGANTLAIHCRQTTGGQYIDCGLDRITPGK